jgi:hypothetical protein
MTSFKQELLLLLVVVFQPPCELAPVRAPLLFRREQRRKLGVNPFNIDLELWWW